MFPSTCWLDNENQLKNSQIITWWWWYTVIAKQWPGLQLQLQLQQLWGDTGPSKAQTSEWRGFFHKERLRHFQRQHCACETVTMFQEESTISFTFNLSVCTSQSGMLFPWRRCLCLLSSHEKQKSYKTESLFFFYISAKPIHPICLAEIFNSSSRFLIAPLLQYIAGYNLTLEQKKNCIYNASFILYAAYFISFGVDELIEVNAFTSVK